MAWELTQNALKQFFETAAGIPFIWDNHPRQLLKKPYGVLRLGVSRSIGRDQVFSDSVAGERELTLNCQIFSRSNIAPHCARTLIDKVRLFLAVPYLKDDLRAAGLVYVESTPVIDLDFSCDLRSESRASFDIIWCYQEAQEIQSPGYFDTVSVEGKR